MRPRVYGPHAMLTWSSLLQLENADIRITELPLRKWTQDYKEFLEAMVKPEDKNATQLVADYKCAAAPAMGNIAYSSLVLCRLPSSCKASALPFAACAHVGHASHNQHQLLCREHHTDTTVDFTVTLTEAGVQAANEKGIMNFFKLSTKMSTSNMMLFDDKGIISKYDSPEHIMKDFFSLRLDFYEKRRLYLLARAQNQLQRISNKVCTSACSSTL